MKSRVGFAILGVTVLYCSPPDSVGGDPPDMAAYIAQIRELGMTERAKGDLSMVAGIRVGSTLLLFEKSAVPGRYATSFMSTACPVPGADPDAVKEWQDELRDREDSDMSLLREHADLDRSGFVSTQEAMEFRGLVEFGYLAAHVTQHEGTSLDIVARAVGLKASETQARVGRYNNLAKRLNDFSEYKVPLVRLEEQRSKGARKDRASL
jgi:hypothetical protein